MTDTPSPTQPRARAGVQFSATGKHRPITPATVTVNDCTYGPMSTIWAGLRWHEAEYCPGSIFSEDDEHLSVPFCHLADDMPSYECGWHRVRARHAGWVFVMAPNGMWILQQVSA